MEPASLSIVLLVRGKAAALPSLVAECLAVAARHTTTYELILVADGDLEASAQAQALAASHGPVAVLHYPRHRGLRAALRDAWSVAHGELIVTLDSDHVHPSELPKLLASAPEDGLAFGYRLPAPRGPQDVLLTVAMRARGSPSPCDPGLRLVLLHHRHRDLLAPTGPDLLAIAMVYAEARRRRLPVTEVAVAARPEARAGQRRRTPLIGTIALIAGGAWLLRRLRPGAKR
ncbi:MAG: hypothetical protein OHK0015_04190 [Chloroflexi bacterium OHK40]